MLSAHFNRLITNHKTAITWLILSSCITAECCRALPWQTPIKKLKPLPTASIMTLKILNTVQNLPTQTLQVQRLLCSRYYCALQLKATPNFAISMQSKLKIPNTSLKCQWHTPTLFCEYRQI